MATLSTHHTSETPVTDAVIRIVSQRLEQLERAGALNVDFEVSCKKLGSRVKHCNVLLLGQDFSIIPEVE